MLCCATRLHPAAAVAVLSSHLARRPPGLRRAVGASEAQLPPEPPHLLRGMPSASEVSIGCLEIVMGMKRGGSNVLEVPLATT